MTQTAWYRQMTQDTNTQARTDTASAGDLDLESLNAIRSILHETVVPPQPAEPVEEAREVVPLRSKADHLPRLAAPLADTTAGELAGRKSKSSGGGILSRFKRKTAEKPKAAPVQRPEYVSGGLTDRISGCLSGITLGSFGLAGYRPKPAHIALAVLALLVLMRPWLIVGLLFLFIFVMVGVFLIAGYDGFWHGVMKANRWYARRRPARAALILVRLDRFAMRWDAVLDRFPEGTVDGLYLPDFGDLDAVEKRHNDAMDRRLAGMQGKGV